MQHSLKSIELFAGAAGLGLGLAKAGFHHEVVVENDRDACETIRLNQRQGHPLVQGWNIREANIEDCDLSDVSKNIDLVAGGPPCQGFSIGGKHKGARDERNLWPWAIKTVAELTPKAFVFENVPNMAASHREYLSYLTSALSLPGIAQPDEWEEDRYRLEKIIATGQSFDPSYDIRIDIHTASDYGTGQKRKRLFIIGIRTDLNASYEAPNPTHSHEELMIDKWVTGAYWDRHGLDRPIPDAEGTAWIRKHNRQSRDLFSQSFKPWQTVRDVFATIPEDASNHEPATRKARAYKGHTGSFIDAPAKTHRAGDHGTSGGEMMVDKGSAFPDDQRYRHFTTREAAALSDFDHDYRFHGTWNDTMRQIGNAVPCKLGEAIGRSLIKAIAA